MRVPESREWVPEWVRRAVFYHIYPLGFLDAPPENNGRSAAVPRLAGLGRWYDHITGLGVTALLLGPIFESSTHGYDTIDYFQIDRRLGDLALFKQIIAELHERGIRAIVDVAFHHTGREFFAFKDLCARGRESQYKDWYSVNWGADSPYHDGFDYACWEGHHALPRLNLSNPATRHYVLEVARMWLGDIGIDGFRLDVAYLLPADFLWELRRVCKEVRPDSFLLGELLGGDYRSWVAPDLLDAGTDYQLHKALWSSLNDRNMWELKAVIERAYHPEWGVFKDLSLLTFLGNHDVSRIRSQLKQGRHVYAALILLLTLPGIPCLYYGDEVGMKARKEDGDAALRQPMPLPDANWPNTDRSLYRITAKLVGLRKAHPALAYGQVMPLEVGYTAFSFLRQHPRETAVIAINAGDEATRLEIPVGREGVPDGVVFHDVLDDAQPTYVVQGGMLTVEKVFPGWGRILIASH